MSPILFDLIILIVFAAFALWGMRKGLVLALFALVATLVSLTGAFLTAKALTPVAADFLEPRVAAFIEEHMTDALQNGENAPGQAPDATLPDDFSLIDILDKLEERGLPTKLVDTVRNVLESETVNAAADTVGDIASKVASEAAANLTRTVAFLIIFLVAFLIIRVLWQLLARALDAAAKLPGLKTLNKAGGFVFGALQGILVLFLVSLLLRWFGSGLIPAATVEKTTLLEFLMTANPLEMLADL